METQLKVSDPLVQPEFFCASSPQSDSSVSSQAGPFRLGKTLGKGTTGIVCVGTHIENGFQVALKIVKKKHVLKTPQRLRVLRREIAVMKLIDHPNIIKLYDVFESDDKIYLVTELATGGELFDLLREGPLTRSEALRLLSQITMGLLHCHDHGIVHRDLKPENLLLDEHKNAKIADFGMAQLMQEGSMLKTSCGSPHYASPEVIAEGRYDGKISDVWSLGVILYAMITGSLPFDHENIPTLLKIVRAGQFEIPEFVDEDIAALLREMIKLDHKERIKMEDIQNHAVFKHTQYFRARKKAAPFSPLTSRQEESSLHRRRHSDSTLLRIDESLLEDLVALLGFESREELRSKILAPGSNTEKSLYSLLVTRKRDRLATLSRLSPRPPSSTTSSLPSSKSSSPVSPFSIPAKGALPPPMELPPSALAPLAENKLAETTEFAPIDPENPFILTDTSLPIFSAGYSSRSPTVRSRRSSGTSTPSSTGSRRESLDSISSGSSRRSSPQVSAPSSRRPSGLVQDSSSSSTSDIVAAPYVTFTEPKTSVTPTGRVRTLLSRKHGRNSSEIPAFSKASSTSGIPEKKAPSAKSWLEKLKEFSKRGKKGERPFKLESDQAPFSASAPSSPTSSSRRLAPLPEQSSLDSSSSPSSTASSSPVTTPTASSHSPPTPRRWFSSFFQRRPSLDPKTFYQQQRSGQALTENPERDTRLRGLSSPIPTKPGTPTAPASSSSSSSSSPPLPPLIVHKTVIKRHYSDSSSDVPAHVFIDIPPPTSSSSSPTSTTSPPSISRSLGARTPSPSTTPMMSRTARTPSPPLASPFTSPVLTTRGISGQSTARTPSPPLVTGLITPTPLRTPTSPSSSTETTPVIYSRKISVGSTSSTSTTPPAVESGIENKFSTTSPQSSAQALEISRRRGEDGVAVVSAMFASSGFSSKKKQGPSPSLRARGFSQEASVTPLDLSSNSSS